MELPKITKMEYIVHAYKIGLQNLDQLTDLLYILTVPFYNHLFCLAVVLCFVLPLMIQEILIRININPDKDCMKNCKCCGAIPSRQALEDTIKHLFGLAPIMYWDTYCNVGLRNF